ncbi:MAG TPA: PAS domain S-box protein [Thermodesulfobacteriota bacterium]|nr:PAS domain S-box protein [Thermodesulfobacteriota bacterium]
MGEFTRAVFNKLFSTSEIAMGSVDLNGVFIDVNEAFLKITKYSREEIVHEKTFRDITPQEYFDLETDIVKELLATENPISYEKEFICKDGKITPVIIKSICLRDADGKPYALAATMLEISKRNFYKDGLIESENKLNALLDMTEDIVCEIGAGGRFVYVSPDLGKLVPYIPSDLKGREFLSFVHSGDAARTKSKLSCSLKTFSKEICTFRFKAGESGWRPVECVIKPFRNSSGDPHLMLLLKGPKGKAVPVTNAAGSEPGLNDLATDLDRRITDLNIIYKITKAVHKSLDLKDLYKIALDMIIELDNVDMAFIYLIDDAKNEAVLEDYRNVPESYVRKVARIPKGKGITWKILESGELYNAEDAQTDEHIGPAGKELGHHGILGVPLTIGGRVIGALYFTTYRNYKFNDSEVSLFRSISEHISVAIAKAKLYEELRKKNKRERIISAVTRSVHRSIDLKNVVQNAADSIKRNIEGADCVAVYTINGSEAALTALSCGNSQIKFYEVFVPAVESATWRLFNTGKPMVNNNIGEESKIDFIEPGSAVKSFVGIPLRYKKRIIGSIHITSAEENTFDIRELGFLRIVTKQIESAIDNAWMAEALKTSEKKYRDLYENVPAGIYCKSYDGRIIMANPTLIQMLGYGNFEEMAVLNRKRSAFVREKSRAEMSARVSKKQSMITEFESSWIKKDGSVIEVIESVRSITNASGRVLYYEGTVTDITERKMFERKLKSSRARLRKLTSYLQQFREEERTLIAREIHDEFAQLLTGMAIDLSWLKQRLPRYLEHSTDAAVFEKLDNFSTLLGSAFDAVKKICAQLRPRVLDELGIVAAIKWQIDAVKAHTNIDFDFKYSEGFSATDPKVTTALFRIFQESLTNIIRHSGATRVSITMRKKDDAIILCIRDNGKGIPESSKLRPGSMGLLGIRERAHELGGEVRIKGVAGRGTSIRVRIPARQRVTC